MLGWALSTAIIGSLVAIGLGALVAPSRSATLYGIVLDDGRALAFVRAMGGRDLVIGGLLAVIGLQRRGAPLGWALWLTAAVALVDYVVVRADRRAVSAAAPARTVDAPVLHAAGAVALVIAGVMLVAGY